MSAHVLVGALKVYLQKWLQITSVEAKLHSGGGTIHIVTDKGRKFRILIDEE